jgi:hypothetical protein
LVLGGSSGHPLGVIYCRDILRDEVVQL